MKHIHTCKTVLPALLKDASQCPVLCGQGDGRQVLLHQGHGIVLEDPSSHTHGVPHNDPTLNPVVTYALNYYTYIRPC